MATPHIDAERGDFADIGLRPGDLGHTGGTLDKLEAIPGYSVTPDTATFRRLARDVGVVMDIKVGSGASMPSKDASRELATTIAEVASRAGTATTALLTDMSQPLAPCAGNALEVREALALDGRCPARNRLHRHCYRDGRVLPCSPTAWR